MTAKNQKKAYIYAAASVLMWSTVASAFKICLRYMDFFMMLFISSFVSLLVLFAILVYQNKLSVAFQLTLPQLMRSIALGFLNPFLYYMILFKSYSLLPAQEAQPLNYVWPIVVVLLSVPLLGQTITIKNFVGIALSFVGVIIISTRGEILGLKFSNPEGVALALISSVVWAFFWLLNVKDDRDEIVKLFLNFFFAFFFIGAYGILAEDKNLPSVYGIAAAVYIGLFEMGITFVFWLKALRYSASSAKVSNLIFLSPFLSLLLISTIVGEKILASSIVGLSLIVLGIITQNINRKQPPAEI